MFLLRLTLNKTTLLGDFIISVIEGSCFGACGEFDAFGESVAKSLVLVL